MKERIQDTQIWDWKNGKKDQKGMVQEINRSPSGRNGEGKVKVRRREEEREKREGKEKGKRGGKEASE